MEGKDTNMIGGNKEAGEENPILREILDTAQKEGWLKEYFVYRDRFSKPDVYPNYFVFLMVTARKKLGNNFRFPFPDDMQRYIDKGLGIAQDDDENLPLGSRWMDGPFLISTAGEFPFVNLLEMVVEAKFPFNRERAARRLERIIAENKHELRRKEAEDIRLMPDWKKEEHRRILNSFQDTISEVEKLLRAISR